MLRRQIPNYLKQPKISLKSKHHPASITGNYFVFIFALILLTAHAPWIFAQTGVQTGAPEQIGLSIGRSMDWPVSSGVPVSVSNGAAVHVRDKGASLRITAKKIGISVIKAGSQVLTVSVLPEASYGLYAQLTEALRNRRGLQLDLNSQRIVIRGRLLRWSDWLALADAAKSSSVEYEFSASLDPSVVKTARLHFQSLLRQARLPDLVFDLTPSPVVVIPGQADELRERIKSVLGPFGFRVEQNSSTLSLEPLVRVRILVAEFRKKMMGHLGVKWPSGASGLLLPSFQFPSGGDVAFNVNALEEKGFGKILASPTLLCRSGKEAQFLAGGELPIRIVSFKANDVIWKRYGVLLKIRPQADYSGRMSIGIETEVSTIDDSQKVDGVPGFLTNRIETHFDLTSGRTIALSGLLKNEWGRSTEGLPGLSSLPILGPLFGSEEYRDNRTELIVFVTPEITRPDQEGE